MSLIPDDLIEQVRDSADIVGIIGETVELKRTGADYRGPCPFHGGTHRNFAVIPKKGLFYCYVCHEKGDVFAYYMKRQGMDYPTAVREVARRVGIVIPDRPVRTGPDPREPIYGAVAAAQDWFARQLLERPDAKAARDYLEGRDVALEAIAPIGLGWAPGGDAFLKAMRDLGIEDSVLLEAGLIVERDDGSRIARFRQRLIFPIHDLRGRPVAFGGRLLGPGEPKYLNSPETPIFHKGATLYNLHQAKHNIRREETAILVEGYFDVLRLVLAGIDNVVAPLGTALTPDQAALLRRSANTVILLYDSDKAGLRATFRGADELLRHGVRVRVATMPDGEDPDSLVKKGGAAALEPILADALDVLERKLQLLERRGRLEGIEHRREAVDKLLPTLRAASDPVTRELYVSLVSERLGIGRDVLEHEVRAPARPHAAGQPAATEPTRAPNADAQAERGAPPRARTRVNAAERDLLRVLLAAPEWIGRAREEVRPEWIESREFREIFSALVASGEAGDALVTTLSPGGQRAWAWLKSRDTDMGPIDADRTYVDVCQAIEARPLTRELDELNRQVATARDEQQKTELTTQIVQLRRELQTRFPEEAARRFHRRPGESGHSPSRPPRRPHAP